MTNEKLYDQIAFPSFNTRRSDGVSELDIAHLLDAAFETVELEYPKLAVRLRRDLFEAMSDPSQDAWDRVFSLPISRRGEAPQMLWSLVLALTDYDVAERRAGEGWPSIPTATQLFLALADYLGPLLHHDSRELF